MPDAARPVTLHIVHDLGGGVERWWRDFCQADEGSRSYVLKAFHLEGHFGRGLVLFDAADLAHPLRLWVFDRPIAVTATAHDEYRAALHEVVAACGVGRVIVSSLIGHSLDALDTALPTLLVVHDYFPACPAINAHFGGVCTSCDDARLAECAQHNEPGFNPLSGFAVADRIAVRRRFLELLDARGAGPGADRDAAASGDAALPQALASAPPITLVSPSHAAREQVKRLVKIAPHTRFEVIAHGYAGWPAARSAAPQPAERLRVLVLGSLSSVKGMDLLFQARHRLSEFADLQFLGCGPLGRFFEDLPGATVRAEYELADLPRHVAQLQPDVGLLASVCAETFGYALTELTLLGIVPVATALGSFAERIVDGETGFLFAPNADALVTRLRQIADDRPALARVREAVAAIEPRSTAAMVADYDVLCPPQAPLADVAPAAENAAALATWATGVAPRFTQLERCAARLRHEVEIQQAVRRERNARLAEVEATVVQRDDTIAALSQTVAERDADIARRDAQLAAREAVIETQLQQLGAARHELAALYRSTSWRLTRPLRFAARLARGDRAGAMAGLRHHGHAWARGVYRRLPQALRGPLVELAYRGAGPLFRGVGHYERWRSRRAGGGAAPAAGQGSLVDLDRVAPFDASTPGRIAIHAHVFYADLIDEFLGQLAQMPFAFSLFVSVSDAKVQAQCRERLRQLPRLVSLVVEVVPNRGRDMAPMLCRFGRELADHDFVAHIHTKKSLYNRGSTLGWREYLVQGLFGSPDRVRRIFTLLTTPGVGLVYPQTYVDVPYQAHSWLANRGLGEHWCRRLGIEPPKGYFDFPVGSMFWARTEALRPLFDAGITLDDFPVEAGQTDGTLAHALERLLGLVPRAAGFGHAVLSDDRHPSWSRWRFDQFLGQAIDGVVAQLTAPEVRAVIFDVFDTLLVRPLLDPEHVKAIVARRIGGEAGRLYLEQRADVESEARERAGRDVGLEDIYRAWQGRGGAITPHLARLHELEVEVETASVQVRTDAAALLDAVARSGRRVLLASDTFLPATVVEAMLRHCGVGGWHRCYVSSDVGLRKDSGELYRHILQTEGLAIDQVAMVGDNERSDFQIPCDMGMRHWHVIRAVEQARAMPRWSALVDDAQAGVDLDASACLGLLVRRSFSALFGVQARPADFAPTARDVGYQVVGPLALAFAGWLAREAQARGIARLCFLSREGALLHVVYDRWRNATGEGPPASYLVLSRRAVTVPMIESIEDVYELARARFYPNELSIFLRERYGLALDDGDWQQLAERGLWRKGRPVEVLDGNIEAVRPVLDHLHPRIVEAGAREKPALMAYLHTMGLDGDDECAVVDVGYSGTIQSRLIRLLGRRIHGYYMIANSTCKNPEVFRGATALGCYADGVPPGAPQPLLYGRSFDLEKMLSSDEEQVIRYEMVEEEGSPQPRARLRSGTTIDARSRQLRAELRQGVDDFVTDAMALRRSLWPGFTVPVALASRLFDAIVEGRTPAEQDVLSAIVLDDYYCGRGLVS